MFKKLLCALLLSGCSLLAQSGSNPGGTTTIPGTSGGGGGAVSSVNGQTGAVVISSLQTVAPLYTGNTGAVRIAPFRITIPTTTQSNTFGSALNQTSVDYLGGSDNQRLISDTLVSQTKQYINLTTNIIHFYHRIFRLNPSGHYNVVCESQDAVGSLTSGAIATIVWTTPCPAKAGDYVGGRVEWTAAAAVNTFSATTNTNSAILYINNNAKTQNDIDFFTNGGAIGSQVMPVEVDGTGPQIVWLADSRGQGYPSGNFVQLTQTGAAAPTNSAYSSNIDLNNQPCAVLQQILLYTCANASFFGATTTQENSFTLPTAIALNPAVIISAGTGNDQGSSISTATTISNIETQMGSFPAGTTKVVVGLEPCTSCSDSSFAASQDVVNPALKTYATSTANTIWAGDAVTLALGSYRTTGPVGNLRNVQSVYSYTDNVHFVNAGALAYATAVANTIEPCSNSNVNVLVSVPQPDGSIATRQCTLIEKSVVDGNSLYGWRRYDTNQNTLKISAEMYRGAMYTPPRNAGGLATLPASLYGTGGAACVVAYIAADNARCAGSVIYNYETDTLSMNNGTINSLTFLGIAGAISTKTANYTMTAFDFTVLCNATSGAVTITLPTTVTKLVYNIKKTDSSANTCTVTAGGTILIDGATTVTLSTQFSNTQIQGNGTQWWVI